MKEKLLEQLNKSICLLPEEGICSGGEEVRTVMGMNRLGIGVERGTYRFSEIKGRDIRYSLVQDTMGPTLIRGVVIQGGKVVETIGLQIEGLSAQRRNKMVAEFLGQFLGCERYCVPEKE